MSYFRCTQTADRVQARKRSKSVVGANDQIGDQKRPRHVGFVPPESARQRRSKSQCSSIVDQAKCTKHCKCHAAEKHCNSFTPEEIHVLLNITESYRQIIDSPKTDAITQRQKDKMWEQIISYFQTMSGNYSHNAATIKSVYETLRNNLRRKMSAMDLEECTEQQLMQARLELVGLQKEMVYQEMNFKRIEHEKHLEGAANDEKRNNEVHSMVMQEKRMLVDRLKNENQSEFEED